MLTHLSIKNYALIDHLEIDFQSGLNIVTGETGSGKSIILGALSLILGERAEKKAVTEGKGKCVVEGTFFLELSKWKPIFDLNDIDFETETILRRELFDTGRSRAFINDTPVNLKYLREIALQLVDIHSQHQTIQLNNPQFQLNVIDTFAKTNQLKVNYSSLFQEYTTAKQQVLDLKNQLLKERHESDFINFQLKELSDLDLDKIDENELEEEYKILSNGDEIAQKLHRAVDMLSGGDRPILNTLKQVAEFLSDISTYSKHYDELHHRVKSVLIELEDVEREISHSSEGIETNPQRLLHLEELKGIIFRLEQKHFVNGVDELLKRREELSQRVSDTEHLEGEIKALTSRVEYLFKELIADGQKLSKKRKSKCQQLEASIQELLGMLNMESAKVQIQFARTSEPMASGIDKVDIRFSANKGRAPESLKNVASGGELSRLMLSIKKLSAGNDKTIILDEIDTGVSGEVAHSMGKIMKEMGGNQQVICITHLPQIASKGMTHFKVLKEERADHTETRIVRLNDHQRVEEIASMLSGNETTPAAIDNAKELLMAN